MTLSQQSVTHRREETKDLLDYALAYRDKGFFNDVTIKIEEECFPANRMVLSCYSPFFEKMFISEMKERQQHSAEVKGVDGKSMEVLINYIYTGTVTIDGDNVMNLLAAADYLQLEDVKTFCFSYLEASFSSENCFVILDAANFFQNESLRKRVFYYIEENLSEVCQTIDFKSMTKDDLCSCIASLDRSRIDETIIYAALVSWTKYDEDERKDEFTEMLQEFINFKNLPSEFLQNVVAKEQYVEDDLTCFKTVMNVIVENLTRLKMREGGSRIVSLGGSKTCPKVVEVYNCFGDPVQTFPNLPLELEGLCALALQNVVYCLGGSSTSCYDESDISCRVWMINLSNSSGCRWREIEPMNEKRFLMGAAVFNDVLVVAGGFDGKKFLSSAEIYLPPINEWKKVSSMKETRSGNALVSCNGSLYSLGGWGGGKFLSSVECLSTFHGPWKLVAPMNTPRRWFAAVNLGGIIFAIGGRSGDDEVTTLKSVERYDPVDNAWAYACDMNIEKCAHAACVLQGKIFVIGGIDRKDVPIKAIECYNPGVNTWCVVGQTNDELLYHSVVVV